MKKLLVVATIPSTLSSFFTYITRHLRAKGWCVDGMASGISSDIECSELFDQVWDVEWSRNPLDPKNLLIAPEQIQAVVNRKNYDLVNVTTPIAAFVTRLALNNLRNQGKLGMIYTAQGFYFYQGGPLPRNITFSTLEKLAGPWTDYLVVVNREDEEAAKRLRLVPSERVRRISGTGLNIDRFNCNTIAKAEVMRVRQEMGLLPETPLFLCVAEFIPRKHPQDILKAFARLARPETCLAFAGDGQMTGQMQKLASELGVQNQVRFLGLRKDIPTLVHAAIATILASDLEGLPNCVMESLCMETPVIGTDIRGTRDLLEEGCGLLVKVGDIEAIAAAMAWILDHPAEARIMGKKGRERIAEYDLKHIVKRYEDLFVEALGKPKAYDAN
jgi:glycosyltransferase involved in cell wall biosynthesis